MSRKKITQQKISSALGLRIAQIETNSGLQRKDFAKKIGCESPYITQLVEGTKTNPSEMFIKAICSEFHVNRQWLKTGEGEIYNKDREAGTVEAGDDSALARDLDLARKILMSGTPYGPALHFNILQFNAGLEAERKAAQVDLLQRDVDELKAQFSAIEKEKAEKEARIRAGDPPEQKEDFLKKRAGLLP